MTRPLDTSGFSLAVRLRAGDDVFPLWTGGGRSERNVSMFFDRHQFDDIPIVTGVTVDVGLGRNPEISVQIAAGFDLGMALLNSQLMQIGNGLEVQLSYPKLGVSTPWYSVLTQKPDFEIGEDGFTATLKGRAAQAAVRSSGRDTWENTTYADVIREIADRPYNGWDVQFCFDREVRPSADEIVEWALSSDPGASPGLRDHPMFADRALVSQQGMPDWLFVSHLCRLAECDVSMVLSESGSPVLWVINRATMFMSKPRYTFQFRGQIDMISRFPIISFKAEGETVSLPRGNSVVTWGDIHPADITDVGGTMDPVNRTARLNAAGVRPGATVGGASGSGAGVLPPEGVYVIASAADQGRTPEQVAAQRVDEDAVRGGFRAEMTTIGFPDIYPGEIIRVEGIGMFSGNYLVSGLIHEVSETWGTSFKLLSNSQGSEDAVSEAFRQSWDDFNDQTSPEGSEVGGDATVDVSAEDPT